MVHCCNATKTPPAPVVLLTAVLWCKRLPLMVTLVEQKPTTVVGSVIPKCTLVNFDNRMF